jgi:hypothetical protein
MKWYVGVNNANRTMTIFKDGTIPTHETHSHLYGYVFGGYKTKKQAIDISNYQCASYHKIILKGE